MGDLTLLPGESAALPQAFEENPVVSFLVERGMVALEGKSQAEEAKDRAEAEAAAKAAAEAAKKSGK